MEFWITLWTTVFVFCLILFAGVAVYVGVGAIGDIRALFRKMSNRDGEAGPTG